MKMIRKNRLTKLAFVSLIAAPIFMVAGCLEKPKGTVNIASEPTALAIFVDGKRKGDSPSIAGEYLGVEVVEGEHQITATKRIDDFEEYFASQEIFVAEGTTQVVLIQVGEEKRISAEGKTNKEAYKIDCDAGQSNKCVILAKHYAKQPDKDAAISANSFYQKACDAQEWSSCYNLANNIFEGVGADQDKSLANSLYEKPCQENYFPACRNLGTHLWRANGVEKNTKKAIEILDKACTGEDFKSCTVLGTLYMSSDARDTEKATNILVNACDSEEGSACFAIGTMLRKSDIKTSKNMFDKGCEFKNEASCKEIEKIQLAEKKKLEAKKAAERNKRQKAAADKARQLQDNQNKIGSRFYLEYSRGSGYTGIVQAMNGDKHFDVKVISVKCSGFLCLQLNASTCSGNENLPVSTSYKRITIPTWCVD